MTQVPAEIRLTRNYPVTPRNIGNFPAVNGGLIAMPDSFLSARRAEATSLAARDQLPAVYAFRFFTELGGLMSCASDIVDNYGRAATYVDRILKGAKSERASRPGPGQVRAGNQPQYREGA